MVIYASVCNLDQSTDRSSLPAMLYFFYGTLCDADVQRLILGYRPNPRQLSPAQLPGFRRKRARGRSYPVLVRSPGGLVDGVLFMAARASDARRLAAYEGPEYLTRVLPVRKAAAASTTGWRRARVFLPAGPALPAGFDDWQLVRWQRSEKAAFLTSLHRQGPLPCANR